MKIQSNQNSKGNGHMKCNRAMTMVAAGVIFFCSLISSGVAEASEPQYKADAAKIAQCMRELQMRYHYLSQSVFIGSAPYINWPSLSLCGNFETPYYPSDDWYELELRDAPDPAEKARDLVNSAFACFRAFIVPDYFYGFGPIFIRKKHWNLEGKSVPIDYSKYAD